MHKTRSIILTAFFVLFLVAPSAQALVCPKAQSLSHFPIRLSRETRQVLERYRSDSIQGMEQLRGENGLPVDTAWVVKRKNGPYEVRKINVATSPTNLAVDLLIQAELFQNSSTRGAARERLGKTLRILSQAKFHQETGLFFSRYSADAADVRVIDPSVSAIDNLHLAVALWTLRKIEPTGPIGGMAGRLFDRMDFSVYYNPAKGLIGGNLRHENGSWIREAYDLANLGSEGRLLYSVGWALGLFRNVRNDQAFLEQALQNLKLEFASTPEGRLMRLWDGSAFQLYFPRIFASEQLYSQVLKENFVNLGNFMIAQGQRLNLPTPAGFNAIRVGTHESLFKGTGSIYRDKAGNPEIISTDNQDVHEKVLIENWDATAAPSAMVMAAAAAPTTWAPILQKLENIKSGDDRLYTPGLGWMEGVHVKGPLQGEVVASQLSLNQGMIVLSLFQMTAPDGLGVSGRHLFQDEQIRKRLAAFYRLFDQKARSTP